VLLCSIRTGILQSLLYGHARTALNCCFTGSWRCVLRIRHLLAVQELGPCKHPRSSTICFWMLIGWRYGGCVHCPGERSRIMRLGLVERKSAATPQLCRKRQRAKPGVASRAACSVLRGGLRALFPAFFQTATTAFSPGHTCGRQVLISRWRLGGPRSLHATHPACSGRDRRCRSKPNRVMEVVGYRRCDKSRVIEMRSFELSH
jgi:hypothetical protein